MGHASIPDLVPDPLAVLPPDDGSPGWLVKALAAKGISRRRFLQWCSAMTAAMALPAAYAPARRQGPRDRQEAGHGLARVPGLRRQHRVDAPLLAPVDRGHRPRRPLARVPRDDHGRLRRAGRGRPGARPDRAQGRVHLRHRGRDPHRRRRRLLHDRRSHGPPDRPGDDGGRRARHRRRRVRLGRRLRHPGAHGRQGRAGGRQPQGAGQPGRMPPQQRQHRGRPGALPHLRLGAAARPVQATALRLRPPDPRPVRAACSLRRRPLRGGVGRPGASQRLVPLQDGLQGPRGHLQLPDRALERRDRLADRRRPRLRRLRLAQLLGHDEPVLRPAARREDARRGHDRPDDRPGRHRRRRHRHGDPRRRRRRAQRPQERGDEGGRDGGDGGRPARAARRRAARAARRRPAAAPPAEPPVEGAPAEGAAATDEPGSTPAGQA